MVRLPILTFFTCNTVQAVFDDTLCVRKLSCNPGEKYQVSKNVAAYSKTAPADYAAPFTEKYASEGYHSCEICPMNAYGNLTAPCCEKWGESRRCARDRREAGVGWLSLPTET